MPTPRRRLAPATRREELLKAAERLLHRHGSAVRVEDIVREAAAAKGTFYTCFTTWDDLLDAVRAQKAAIYRETVAPPLDHLEGVDWEKVLLDFAASLVDFILSLGGLHQVLMHSAFAVSRPLPPKQKPSAYIAEILRAGHAAGCYAALDREPTADLMFALIHETADAIAAGGDHKRLLKALNEVLLRIVQSEKAMRGAGLRRTK